MKQSTGVHTCEGFIPHEYNSALKIWMPVMVQKEGNHRIKPRRIEGRVVYALPGGGIYVPTSKGKKK